MIFALDSTSPPAESVFDLACSANEGVVEITFDVSGRFDVVDAEEIEIHRDGAAIATLGGDVRSFEDSPPPGVHIYSVRARRGDQVGPARRCTLRSGPGSETRRALSWPVPTIHQITFDPVANEYVTASNARSHSKNLHLFDTDLQWRASVPGPFRETEPEQIAALTVRSRGDQSEVVCIGWRPGAAPGTQNEFPVRIVTRDGTLVREFMITPPRPIAPRVPFPSGLAWDAERDTLWYLERNAQMLVEIDLEGNALQAFPHPAPLHQDRVHNFGLAIDAERNVLLVSTGNRMDQTITEFAEIDRSGRLTGIRLRVGLDDGTTKLRGFALSPPAGERGTRELVASTIHGGIADLVAYSAYSSVPPVRQLVCQRTAELEWIGDERHTGTRIERDGVVVATLPAATTSWRDADLPDDASEVMYRVVALAGDEEAPGAVCIVPPPRLILRGDVDENGELNITDAVGVLSFLFAGDVEIDCLDTADVNDDGTVNLTDPIAALNFLFSGANAPRAPYPIPGVDPTPDDLDCSPSKPAQ